MLTENGNNGQPESNFENNFSSFATESSKGKLNAIFPPEKLLKCGKIALFIIVRLKQGDSLKPTLQQNCALSNYLAGINK